MTRPNLKAVKPPKRPSIALLRRAVKLFRNDMAPREVRRANARKWLRSVALLGDSWVLAGRKEVGWGAKQRKEA